MLAALYIRVSSETQVEGFSLPAQLKALREYCLKNGITIYKEYADEGISGSKEDRPQFQQMIQEASDFDIILVHKFDRFARKVELSQRIKNQLKKNNVNVISITEPVEDSPIGFFQEGIMELLSEYYIRNLSREVKKGKLERASQGLWNGGPYVAYGYSLDNSMLVINPEQAEIVRMIFNMYKSGIGYRNIAKYLRDQRIFKPSGKQFEDSDTQRILKNVLYSGKIYFSGNIYPGQHEAIIDQDTFDWVQREMNCRDSGLGTAHRRDHYEKFYLIGIVYCGHCGANLRAVYQHSYKTSWSQYAYVCSRASKSPTKCKYRKQFKAEKLEREIVEMLKNIMAGSKPFDYTVVKPFNYYKLFEGRKIKIKDELTRAKQAYLGGVFDMVEYRETKDKLEEELKEIETEMKNKKGITNDPGISDRIKNIWQKFLNEPSPNEKRLILKSVVDHIKIYSDGRISIFFKG